MRKTVITKPDDEAKEVIRAATLSTTDQDWKNETCDDPDCETCSGNCCHGGCCGDDDC